MTAMRNIVLKATVRWMSSAKTKSGKVNVLVLNAGSSSFKFGLFSVSSKPSGHDWLPKDSSMIAAGFYS